VIQQKGAAFEADYLKLIHRSQVLLWEQLASLVQQLDIYIGMFLAPAGPYEAI
jgi:hypothetical protein